MFLIILMIGVTLAISGSAAYFSVFGLAHIFATAFIPSIIMGGALEAGKLVAASFLYRYWHKTHFVLRAIMVSLVAAVMLFTSIGIFGFLMAAHQTGAIGVADNQQRIEFLLQEKNSYELRLKNIDTQVNSVPDSYVSKKIQLKKTLDTEKKDILSKLEASNTERIALQSKQITDEAKLGPIIYVAKALNKPAENSVIYLVIFIVFIFDPLAVTLTIATNIALKSKRDETTAVNEILPVPVIEPIINPPPNNFDPTVLNPVMEKLNELVDTLNKNNKRNDIIKSIRDV